MRYSLRQIQSPQPCGYLPDRLQSLEYIIATSVSAEEYQLLMERGWRHFGHTLFRPACPGCVRCRTVRVDAARFAPNRSQRRVIRRNAGELEPVFSDPECRDEVLELEDLADRDEQVDDHGHAREDRAGHQQCGCRRAC